MKKIILILAILASNNANANTFFLVSCSFGYQPDYNQSGYTGIYRSMLGNHYSYFFPSESYSWCPQSIEL